MTKQPYVDPGHRIPDEEWAAVVRRAQEIAEEAAAHKTGGAAPIAAPVLDMRGRSNKHSGVSGVATQLLVLHSAECPLRGGYAQSLTEWAITSNVVASWHRFVDPIARVYMMDDSVAAWHASEANPMSIGWEQAGYARFTRDQWLTPDGLLQLNSLAYDMAQVALRDGIPAVWLTTDQVTAITTYGDRATKGFCLHRQIDPETRTDPGDGYPYELLMSTIRNFMGLSGTSAGLYPDTTEPSEEDDMGHVDTISEDAMKELARKLWEYDFTNANGNPNRPIWILQSLPETLAGLVRDTVNGVLRGPLKWFGFDGKQPDSGRTTTSVETALGFADTIAAEQDRKITELRSVVDQLALGQGVTIDYQQIAKAVVDEEARRLTPPAEGGK